jgi:hypothetical protein
MNVTSFAVMTRDLTSVPSRRDILRGIAGAGLGLGSARVPDVAEARKKHKRKKKRKKKCGKAGGKPVKGTCCKKSIRVDDRCRRCDVCASGCAFSSVQDAIEAASAGDTIALCPGTYRENLWIDGVLGIATPLRLIGAGDGARGTIVQGPRDVSVVQIAASVVSLEHLRITGGDRLGGGGIVNYDATVELISCTISGNNGQIGDGGGIWNQTGTLTLRNSTVSDNEAGAGGGVYNSGTLIVIASTIHGNEASHGGGIFNHGNTFTVTVDAASQITGNTATTDGGGIYNNFGTVILASSEIVSGNSPNNCVGRAVPNCTG